ncbi:MAG: NCS2 family permease [Micrococcales bacterium]|nr:NCS2 family permease [Micrococcales bacterium]
MSSTTTAPQRSSGGSTNAFDRFFHITERGSSIGTEIRGGFVTFFTMAYIIVLNPIILGGKDGGGNVLAAPATIAATTALVAGVMSIVMGVGANYPLALATGLGINSVVAFSIAPMAGWSWQDAMGIVVMEGILMLILVLTGFRKAVFNAVPKSLKTAIGVGIGLFIAFVGVSDAGFVTPGDGTITQLGANGSLTTWPVFVFCLGLIAMVILMIKKIRGAILIAILGTTIVGIIVEAIAKVGLFGANNPGGWQSTVPVWPKGVVSTPNFSLLGHFSIVGPWKHAVVLTVVLVFSLLLADFFDTMGTMVAIGGEAGLLDKEGNPPHTQRILVVDSVGAIAGGAAGVSSNTAYIESASGVGDGARTGLAPVVTGVCFLLATFLAPLVAIIPAEAAAPALVVVGFLMVTQILDIDWKRWDVAIPAFFAMIMMPFTYSITVGIGAGVILYVVLQAVTGKVRQIHPFMWVIAVLFVAYFMRSPIQALVG